MTLPLEGIKVLDLTRWLAGPICTALLGDLGAEVIKVESLPKGDATRLTGPFVEGGESAYFLSINRNKKSLALNFRSQQGKEAIRKLAHTCDVLVENFKVGVMADMGFPYESLARENPRLVYGAITAYGLDGPYRDRPGLDQIAQGMGGISSVTGFDKDSRVRVGIPIADVTTGMFAALSIVSALHERGQTGKGRQVEVSLVDSTIGLMCFQAQRYLSLGEVAEPQGNNHPLIAPCGVFETSNGPMNICVSTGPHWDLFCDLVGAAELKQDPRFSDNSLRKRNRDDLLAALNPILLKRTREEWTEILAGAGIPAGPLYDLEGVFNDPHARARNVVETVAHPTARDVPLVRSPLRMEGLERSIRLAPPVLGQHTREVLASVGYAEDDISRLLQEGVALQAEVSGGR